MSSNIDSIRISFRDASAKMFFASFERFRKLVVNIDRQLDKHEFDQIKITHMDELEKELTQSAKEMIECQPVNKELTALSTELKLEINYYLTDFISRTRAM